MMFKPKPWHCPGWRREFANVLRNLRINSTEDKNIVQKALNECLKTYGRLHAGRGEGWGEITHLKRYKWMDWILLRKLILLEHFAVLKTTFHRMKVRWQEKTPPPPPPPETWWGNLSPHQDDTPDSGTRNWQEREREVGRIVHSEPSSALLGA